MPVRIPAFAEKLRHLYAHTGFKLATLAEELGVKSGTVSGWVHGTKTNDPETVPEQRFEALAELLTRIIGVSIEHARRLWMGDAKTFAKALQDGRNPSFESYLRNEQRTSILSFLKSGVDEARLVTFHETGDGQGDATQANIGDAFAFAVKGEPGAHVVLMVESNVGLHLGVPGRGSPTCLDANGDARLPSAPGAYRFAAPACRHTFTVLLIKSDAPLAISAYADRAAPLGERELSALASDLGRTPRANWCFDRLIVDVR